MKRIDIVRQLVADLLDDHQHFQRIETLLSAQRQAIISFTPSQLESHTEQLMEHYRHIHQHAQQRIRGLQQLSLSADQHGMRQLLESLAPAAQQHLLTIWRDLPTQLQRCQHANNANQQLLEMQHSLFTEWLPETDPAAWLYHPDSLG
ncbi:flagellar protein FlgN [Rosenbergiella epipactidis]|uniref:flagellar protein FlgN n=1 Tax=Rosenbergiella epipactidis TaxID=1544694 RepID=UPI001BDAFF31|nr:flagellar protein FlgN [Rosenbergiella epipactidis]MBT0718861.1 flagellar protein FlgN [Rosenbergiella epipactidis]